MRYIILRQPRLKDTCITPIWFKHGGTAKEHTQSGPHVRQGLSSMLKEYGLNYGADEQIQGKDEPCAQGGKQRRLAALKDAGKPPRHNLRTGISRSFT